MANKVRSLLGGPGFYAVLALCIVAAGVGGYFLLLREDPQAAVPAVPDTEASAPSEDLPEHEPFVGSEMCIRDRCLWRSRRRNRSLPSCRR